MAINAQRALGKLVPDVEEMFKGAVAVTINSSRIMLVSTLSMILWMLDRKRLTYV